MRESAGIIRNCSGLCGQGVLVICLPSVSIRKYSIFYVVRCYQMETCSRFGMVRDMLGYLSIKDK